VVIWALLGIFIGIASIASLIRQVGRLMPGELSRVRRVVFRMYLVRYLLLGITLALAIRPSVGAGLAVFVGFWITRWAGVYLGRSGKIVWSRLS
jgi:hypothetical protein